MNAMLFPYFSLSLTTALLFLAAVQNGHGQGSARQFDLNGISVGLAEVTAQVDVFYRSMRFNRVSNEWNFEVVVSNKSAQAISGPLVLVVDSLTGSSGARRMDGVSEGKAFFDLSSRVTGNAFDQAAVTLPRTLGLAYTAGQAPQFLGRVFAKPEAVPMAVAFTRTLNSVGQPLPGARIDETGPDGTRTLKSDPTYAGVTLGQREGPHVWRFTAPGYRPVWRRAVLSSNGPAVLPYPRLAQRSDQYLVSAPGTAVVLSNLNTRISFPANAFPQGATNDLSLLDSQSLPFPLPQGWSPLCAFTLESSVPPASQPALTAELADNLARDEQAALVQLDEQVLVWNVRALVPGTDTRFLNDVPLPGAGTFAFVVPDTGAGAPSFPAVGEPLPAGTLPLPAPESLLAWGNVIPEVSPASKIPELVTGQAEVVISNRAGLLPSGTALRGQVSEIYDLQDKSRLAPPGFDAFVVAYQRPGDGVGSTLHARFGLRPVLLFEARELSEARVHVDLYAPDAFSGGSLGPEGGLLVASNGRLVSPAGAFSRPQLVQFRGIEITNFSTLAEPAVAVAAFDIAFNDLAPGKALNLLVDGLFTNASFVLARTLMTAGNFGLEPRERLRTDAQGLLHSDEPAAEPRLPGLTVAGQYLLLRVDPRQGLVAGVARDATGFALAGLPVRIKGQPWLTFSATDGSYKLLAPAGPATVAVTDAAGNTGTQTVTVPPDLAPVADASVAALLSGPRVIAISPTNSAVNVQPVASVTLDFSRPLNPASMVGSGISLTKTNGDLVAATLSLNLANNRATLLPNTPLDFATRYVVQASTNLVDTAGRKLEGPNVFTFDTVPLSARDPGAQLIIYEPGATNVPTEILSQIPAYRPGTNRNAIVVRGTPGAADPGVAVILANESSGETATVLSKPDGSFVSVIEGTEEDYVSATFVNLNNSRVYVPVSRQLFDNGFVGLYRQGGILEAESDGGPVQVYIQPEAIQTRTKLRLMPLRASELKALLGGVEPIGSKVAGGAMQLEVEGRPPENTKVSFPVNLLTLGMTTNDPPTEAGLAITVVHDQDGAKTFEVVSQGKFTPRTGAAKLSVGKSAEGTGGVGTHTPYPGTGGVRTHTPYPGTGGVGTHTPYPGTGGVGAHAPLQGAPGGYRKTDYNSEEQYFGMIDGVIGFLPGADIAQPIFQYIVVPLLVGNRAVAVKGQVVQAPEADATGNIIGDAVLEAMLQSGAARPLGGAFIILWPAISPPGMPGRLQPGMVHATSDKNGEYLMIAPWASEAYVLSCTHPKFQERLSEPIIGIFNIGLSGAVFKRFVFRTPIELQTPPRVTINHAPLRPAPGQEALVEIFASQGSGPPEVRVALESVKALAPGIEPRLDEVAFRTVTNEVIQAKLRHVQVGVKATNAVSVTLRVLAVSPNGISLPQIHYAVPFGGSPPVVEDTIVPSDPNEKQGPAVIGTIPGEQDFLSGSGDLQIIFNEPISKLVEEDTDGIIMTSASGKRYSPVVRLNANQHVLSLAFPGLDPDSQYSLTLTGTSIRDLNENPLDQKPSTRDPDNFTMTLRTAPVAIRDLPGVNNGRGAAIYGTRLYVIDSSAENALLVYNIERPDAPELLGKARVVGTPRDLVVIPDYAYKLRPDEDPQTNTLVAVVGGDLESISDSLGVTMKGMYLRVFDVRDGKNPVELAAPIVTYRVGSAVTKVKWEPPHLIYQEFGADIQLLGFVNLQEMLWGYAATPERIGNFGMGREGKDANNDGDYVDPEDVLPIPPSRPVEFFGKKFNEVIEGTTQKVLDFSYSGGTLGVTLGTGLKVDDKGRPFGPLLPVAYRTVTWFGDEVVASQATVPFDAGAYPKRVSVFQPMRLEIAGTNTYPMLALVSLTPDTDGRQKLAVIDITLPHSPKVLGKVPIPDDLAGGALQTVSRREDGYLELATSTKVIVLNPANLVITNTVEPPIHPAIVGIIPNAGAGTKTVGSSHYGVYAVAESRNAQLVQTAPPMSFVYFPEATGVVNPLTLRADPSQVEEMFQKMVATPALVPGRFRTDHDAPSTLSPPDPKAHFHVLMRAPGGCGMIIQLGLEALNGAGLALPNPGIGFAPVRAMTDYTLTQLNQHPRPGCGAPIRPLTAYRMSDDFRSPYYNLYLSKPFALAYERVSLEELDQLKSQLDREILWTTSFLRAFIDPQENANGAVLPFVAQIDSNRSLLRPVASVTAYALDASYVMGDNPEPVEGATELPGTLGLVSAHNGEFRAARTDLELPSPRMPIQISRAIASQDSYDGPFGLGWDFNYNQRLTELDPAVFPQGMGMPLISRATKTESVIASSRDLLFHSGQGRSVLFRWVSTNLPPEYEQDPLVKDFKYKDVVSDYYLPEKGVFDLLVKFKDGRFERLTPEGTRYLYAPGGRLEKITDRYPDNYHQLEYDRNGWLTRIDDRSVRGDRYVELGHYRRGSDPDFTTDLDEPTSSSFVEGKICRLRDYAKGDVLYYYSDNGLLSRTEGVKVAGENGGFSGRPKIFYSYKDCRIVGMSVTEGGTPAFNAVNGGNASSKPVAQSGNGMQGPVSISVPANNSAANVNGMVSSSTQADGSKTELTFDKFGRPARSKVSGPRGATAESIETRDDDGLLLYFQDPEGASRTFTYDTNNPVFRSRGNLLSIQVNPGSRGGDAYTETFNYDKRYGLQEGNQRNPNGFNVTHTLTGDGRATDSITHGSAGQESFAYNDHGQMTSHTSPDGTVVSWDYDSETGFIRTQRLGDNAYAHSYGSDRASLLGRASQISYPSGTPRTFKYNAHLALVESARGESVEQLSHDQFGRATNRVTFLGEGQKREESQTYTDSGFLTSVRIRGVEVGGAEQDLTWSYTPDELLRVKSVKYPGNATLVYEYDNFGNVKKSTLGSYVEEFEYDLNGNVTSLSQGGSVVKTVEYDGLNRTKKSTLKTGAGEEVQSFTYYPNGECKTYQVRDSQYQVLTDISYDEIDALGRTKKLTSHGNVISPSVTHEYAAGERIYKGPRIESHRTWNTAGYETGVSDPVVNTILTPDGNGRMQRSERREPGATYSETFAYNGLDQRTASSDALGLVFGYAPRADGSVLSITNGRGNFVTLKYNNLGENVERRRSDGSTLRMTHDPERELKFKGDPAGGFGYEYDDTKRLTSRQLRNGGKILYSDFDALNMPTTINLPGGTIKQTYDLRRRMLTQTVSYEGTFFEQTASYDGLDRVRKATYRSGTGPFNTAAYEYDPAGPLLSSRFQEDGADYTVGFGYYDDASRETVRYPSGSVVAEDRDQTGRLIAIADAKGDILRVGAWQGLVQPKRVSLGNVMDLVYQYDTRGRMAALLATRRSDDSVLVHLRYEYDGADNIIVRQDLHRGGLVDTFAYDAGERLARATVGAFPTNSLNFVAPQYSRSYAYEPSGLDYLVSAPVTSTQTNLPPFSKSWSGHDQFLQPVKVDNFTRGAPDPMGNVKAVELYTRPAGGSDPAAVVGTLTHDGLGRLVKVVRADSTTVECQYSHENLRYLRVVTSAAGVQRNGYVYDPAGRLLEEYDRSTGTSLLVARYYYAASDAPVAADLRDAATGQLNRYYYLRDAADSVVAVADETGKVVERAWYDPHGQPTLQARDEAPPVISQVLGGASGSLIVLLSEPVTPARADPGEGTGVVPLEKLATNALELAYAPSGDPVAGTVGWLLDYPGAQPGSVLKFTPSKTVTGQVTLTFTAGVVTDEWGVSNLVATVSFSPTNPPGTVYYSPPSPPATAPQRLSRSAISSPFLFQGQYFDYETGLIYLRARFYDPFSGMFLEPDPLGYEESVNLYAGLANNPVNRRDPSGLSTTSQIMGRVTRTVEKKVLAKQASHTIGVARTPVQGFLDAIQHSPQVRKQIQADLRRAVAKGELPSVHPAKLWQDFPRVDGRTPAEVRDLLGQHGFVKMKGGINEISGEVAGVATKVRKTDSFGGSEMWVRLSVTKKGNLNIEGARLDEFGHFSKFTDAPHPTDPARKVGFGEPSHFHKESFTDITQLDNYLKKGLQYKGEYLTPNSYDDAGKLVGTQRFYQSLKDQGARIPIDHTEATHIWLDPGNTKVWDVVPSGFILK